MSRRHIAITGASSGIGEGLVRHFAAKGWKVSMVARRQALMEALAEAYPQAETFVAAADLTDLDHCTDWVAAAEAALGPIDVLVNNAGAQFVEPTIGVTDERAEWLFRLNTLAPMRLGRRVVGGMLDRGYGTLVNIASVAALQPTPHMGHYGGTKAALAQWSEVMRSEVAARGVHVLTVYPGPVETPLEAAAREKIDSNFLLDQMPMGTPAELAQKIDDAIASRSARLVYPAFYLSTRWFPALSQWVSETFAPKAKEH